MSQEMELAGVFLRYTHPEADGWVLSRGLELENVTVDYAYKRYDVMHLFCFNMVEPFVSRKQLEQAQKLQKACKEKYPELVVKIQLVYKRLLMNPHKLPKGISVLSIMDDELEHRVGKLTEKGH